VVDHRSGALEFGVGSGVVWDSDPEEEYEECLLKGSVLGRVPQPFELLETLRWTPGEGFFLLERHLGRLRDSAEYFAIDCPLDRVRDALDRAVASADRVLRVRLLLAGGGTVRTEQAPLDGARDPLRVGLATHPTDPSDVFLFHKTTNRRQYEQARRPGLDDVILWNPVGEATESTIANLVVELDGRRVTPPVACGLLGGTFRAELISTGEVVEAPVRVDRLRAAPRIWLVNSVRGWRQATFVADGR
jgi:para-aminobenzoate synthetase/4-amino-4-deoxychorismate lyase